MTFEKAEKIHDKIRDLAVELENQKMEYLKEKNYSDAQVVMGMIVKTNELFEAVVETARKAELPLPTDESRENSSNAPMYNESPEQEAERLGLTGVAKELYPDWQTGKITAEEYVRAILKDLGVKTGE